MVGLGILVVALRGVVVALCVVVVVFDVAVVVWIAVVVGEVLAVVGALVDVTGAGLGGEIPAADGISVSAIMLMIISIDEMTCITSVKKQQQRNVQIGDKLSFFLSYLERLLIIPTLKYAAHKYT